MTFTPLPQSFYEPSAESVALQLLGHWLIRHTSKGACGGLIVETEAYLDNDPACHAYCGKTSRNQVMWAEPGLAYVYLIYGYHYCVNAVCRPAGTPEAVLIRAIEPTFGMEILSKNRPVESPVQLTNGPAKLCSAMQIDRDLDGLQLFETSSPLLIAFNKEAESFRSSLGPVVQTTRIGITKAAELPLRFYLPGSPYVSRKPRVGSRSRKAAA